MCSALPCLLGDFCALNFPEPQDQGSAVIEGPVSTSGESQRKRKESPESKLGDCSRGRKGGCRMREEGRVCESRMRLGEFQKEQLPFWGHRLEPREYSGSGPSPPYAASQALSSLPPL